MSRNGDIRPGSLVRYTDTDSTGKDVYAFFGVVTARRAKFCDVFWADTDGIDTGVPLSWILLSVEVP